MTFYIIPDLSNFVSNLTKTYIKKASPIMRGKAEQSEELRIYIFILQYLSLETFSEILIIPTKK